MRIPHTNTYTLTPDGLKTTIFYTKLDHRLLSADQPPAPAPLRAALATIDKTCTDYIARARLALAT